METPVTLRAMEPTDIDTLYIWENDPLLWPYGDRRAPLSRLQLTEYVNNYNANPFADGQLRLMISAEDKTVGAVDIFEVDAVNRRAGVGIMVAKRYQGHGYARAALNALMHYCRECLGLTQLWCVVAVDNEPSMRLFLSAGFKESGRLSHWLLSPSGATDAAFLQLLL